VSSHGESAFALDSPNPPRIAFDLPRVLRTDYITNDLQPAYIVLDSFGELLARTLETDFAALSEELDTLPDIGPGELLPTDRLVAPDIAIARAA
jgi:phenylalanine-4-hydroxylase